MKLLNSLALLSLLAIIVFACGEEEPVCEETYNSSVKAIVDRSCAYAGCHSGNDAGMFVPDVAKDYTSYSGLLANLNSGVFKERALDSLDMPPFYTPDGNPKELSATEIEIISCWLNNGHPEN